MPGGAQYAWRDVGYSIDHGARYNCISIPGIALRSSKSDCNGASRNAIGTAYSPWSTAPGSPSAKSGLLFFNTLLDEKAANHVVAAQLSQPFQLADFVDPNQLGEANDISRQDCS